MSSTPKTYCEFFFVLVLCSSQNFRSVHGGGVKRSDDFSLEGLQVLVQQQAAAISNLQASLASLQYGHNAVQSKVAELDGKVGALSKAVAFSVRFSGDDIPLSSHSILQFDHVVTNAGNGYNPANGIFTAPVAGYYAFSIVMMEPNGENHPSLALSIVKNGSSMDVAWATNHASTYDEQGSTHTVLHLAAGDQVWIRQESGNAVRGVTWTVFTGYLVHVE